MTKPILIVVTRENRAERPSEAGLEAGFEQLAQAAEADMLGSPEDYDTDSFVKTVPRRDGLAGIDAEIIRVTRSRYSAFQETPDDGLAVYEYPHGGGTRRDTLKSKTIPEHEDMDGSIVPEQTITEEVTVRVTEQNEAVTEQVFTTLADARTHIDSLHSSDGYVMFGNFENKTEVLETRPCLWDIPGRVLSLMQPVRHAARLNEDDRN